MSGEAWTEYVVEWGDASLSDPFRDRARAESLADGYPEWGGIVKGRTVTASEWLPVDGEGR